MRGARLRVVIPVLTLLLFMLAGGAHALASGRASPPVREADLAIIEVGRASWVRASLGDEYLALPRTPRGTRVRICGEAACVVRVQTDVGPNQRVHPDRIADLSRRDFEKVSGLSTPQHGTAMVTVEYLSSEPGPRVTLPPTDTEP